MSRETTFERNLHAVRDRAALGEIFTLLCQQVARRSMLLPREDGQGSRGGRGRIGRRRGCNSGVHDLRGLTRDAQLQAIRFFKHLDPGARTHAEPTPDVGGQHDLALG